MQDLDKLSMFKEGLNGVFGDILCIGILTKAMWDSIPQFTLTYPIALMAQSPISFKPVDSICGHPVYTGHPLNLYLEMNQIRFVTVFRDIVNGLLSLSGSYNN